LILTEDPEADLDQDDFRKPKAPLWRLPNLMKLLHVLSKRQRTREVNLFCSSSVRTVPAFASRCNATTASSALLREPLFFD